MDGHIVRSDRFSAEKRKWAKYTDSRCFKCNLCNSWEKCISIGRHERKLYLLPDDIITSKIICFYFQRGVNHFFGQILIYLWFYTHCTVCCRFYPVVVVLLVARLTLTMVDPVGAPWFISGVIPAVLCVVGSTRWWWCCWWRGSPWRWWTRWELHGSSLVLYLLWCVL